jgi:ribonuclease HII
VTAGILIAGVDEAGRGPLAGPVVAAAVVLDPAAPVEGLRDSKALTAATRERLAETIQVRALGFGLGLAEVEEIDGVNILQATLRAMARAVAALPCRPARVLVDGNRCPSLDCPAEAVVGGDRTVEVISAASILAKVARDAIMLELDRAFPAYGFAAHKGYPTRSHRERLLLHGPCEAHRRSFAPVRRALQARAGGDLGGRSR